MRFAIFCHSLKSCWNHGNAHFLRGIASELHFRGHQVTIWESSAAWSRLNLVAQEGEAALNLYREAYPHLDIREWGIDPEGPVELDPLLDGVDVVLVHEWTDPVLVSRIARHRVHQGRYSLLFHDTHHRSATAPSEMAAYELEGFDGVLAFGEHIRELYLRRGWAKQVFTWHEAADTRIFRPLQLNSDSFRAAQPSLTASNSTADNPRIANQIVENQIIDDQLVESQSIDSQSIDNQSIENQNIANQIFGKQIAHNQIAAGQISAEQIHEDQSRGKELRDRQNKRRKVRDTQIRSRALWGEQLHDEVIWIGNWGDGERDAELTEFLLKPVRELGIRGNVHGVRYSSDVQKALGSHGLRYRGWTPNHRVPQHFAQHLFTVHIPRRPYAKALPGIPTIRPFEAMACGIPLVSAPWRDVEGLFSPGNDHLVARNGREMVRNLRQLRSDADLREELSRQGLSTILARHTCRHRVDELMAILAELGFSGEESAPASTLWNLETQQSSQNVLVHSGILYSRSGYSDIGLNSIEESQIGLNKIGLARSGQSKIGQSKIGRSKIGQAKIGRPKIGQAKIGQAEIGQSKIGRLKIGQAKIGQAKIGQAKIGQAEIGQSKIGQSKIGRPKIGQAKIRQAEIGDSKIGQNELRQAKIEQAKIGQAEIGQNRPEKRRFERGRAGPRRAVPLKIAFFGSSLVSAYWNGAATYYRGILRALAQRGHQITFYEPDAFDRQKHRDIPDPSWAKVVVYSSRHEDFALNCLEEARAADLLVKASGVGVFDSLLEREIALLRSPQRQVAFWDVDAPATLERLRKDPDDPFHIHIPSFDWIFTYGGGYPVVSAYSSLGANSCIPIYNALDPHTHHPCGVDGRFAGSLGFLANRLPDREARVQEFFLQPAQRWFAGKGNSESSDAFVLGGSGWDERELPRGVRYVGHVYTRDHNAFNCSALAVLNVNRSSMAENGFSPATRVFEAAGAGACLITDAFEGVEEFLEPGSEVLIARDGEEVLSHLQSLNPERARAIGQAARLRVLAHHTYEHRARQLDSLWS